MNTPPSDSELLFKRAEQLNQEYLKEDEKNKLFIEEKRQQRDKFAHRGPKRHESKPHHLPGSPVKAEAIIIDKKDLVPWRRH